MSWSVSILTFLALPAPALVQDPTLPLAPGPTGGFGPGSVCKGSVRKLRLRAPQPRLRTNRKQGKARMEHTPSLTGIHISLGHSLNSRAPRLFLLHQHCGTNPCGRAAAAPIGAGYRVKFGSICTIMLLIIQTLFCVCRYRSLLARWKILRKNDCN